jgi:hypothetical protein
MSKTKRVVFSFDEKSFESLEKLTKQGRYPSMASAVKESLQINSALQGQVEQGFTEIVVRNPDSDKERVIIIPTLPTNK